MNKLIFASAIAALFTSGVARADEVQPDSATTFNVAVTSDYRYRGISQTRLRPALQGGADYVSNVSGLYAGTWLSTIKWIGDAGGGGDVEWDLYAGRRGVLGAGIGYDIGVLGYVYPANGLAHVAGFADANTAEVYGQLSYGPTYLKYSQAVTNLFGFVDSKRSGYIDLGANVDAGRALTINLHAGRQRVTNSPSASYTDWKIGATRDFGVASVALALIGTNASQAAYASPANGRFLGKRALQLTLSRTF